MFSEEIEEKKKKQLLICEEIESNDPLKSLISGEDGKSTTTEDHRSWLVRERVKARRERVKHREV